MIRQSLRYDKDMNFSSQVYIFSRMASRRQTQHFPSLDHALLRRLCLVDVYDRMNSNTDQVIVEFLSFKQIVFEISAPARTGNPALVSSWKKQSLYEVPEVGNAFYKGLGNSYAFYEDLGKPSVAWGRFNLPILIPQGILLKENDYISFDWMRERTSLDELKAIVNSGNVGTRLTVKIQSKASLDTAQVENIAAGICARNNMYPTRLLKNVHSADAVLLSLKGIRTVGDLKRKLSKFVYPWAKIILVENRGNNETKTNQEAESYSKASFDNDDLAITNVPWAIEYETSAAVNFEKDLIQFKLTEMVLKWKNQGLRVVDASIGFANKSDIMANVYYPIDGREKGHLGILVTPTHQGYRQFYETGAVHGIPRRLMLKDLGAIPITIQNPANFTCFYSLGGVPVDDNDRKEFEKRKNEFHNRREENGPFVSPSWGEPHQEEAAKPSKNRFAGRHQDMPSKFEVAAKTAEFSQQKGKRNSNLARNRKQGTGLSVDGQSANISKNG